MARATTQALAASVAALSGISGVTEQTAGELFTAARLIDESSQLSGALADTAATTEARQKLVAASFANASAPTKAILAVVVAERWSRPADLVLGIEELAIRAAASAAGDKNIEGELFAVMRMVVANPELELALGNRLGDGAAKAGLAGTLLEGKVSSITALVVTSLVRASRGRRVRALLTRANNIVADARGQIVATVHTATALSAAQRTRLADSLTRRYERAVAINEIVDPAIIGGMRVQLADDVIDGSISARLATLRQKLAS